VFKRLSYESNADALAIAALFLFLALFIFFIIRAFRMKRNHLQHMSQLPLDDDSTHSPES
jgi:cbb3-type cytochrome oxidase subunit 3